MKAKTFIFKALITLDYALNVVTGGGLQTCFSTRCYYNSIKADTERKRKFWLKMRDLVDAIMFEEHHCLKSYRWEVRSKRDWIEKFKI